MLWEFGLNLDLELGRVLGYQCLFIVCLFVLTFESLDMTILLV